MTKGWHLPFEDVPGDPVPMQASPIAAGSVTVAAAVVPTPLGRFPVLVFTFTGADGRALEPIALLLDAEHMAHVPLLVGEAVASALKAART